MRKRSNRNCCVREMQQSLLDTETVASKTYAEGERQEETHKPQRANHKYDNSRL